MSSIEVEAARRHPGVGAIAVMRRNEFTEGARWALEQAENAVHEIDGWLTQNGSPATTDGAQTVSKSSLLHPNPKAVRAMLPESECPYFAAKGMHLYVGYRVAATGQTGECCHGCGIEPESGEQG